MGHHIWGAGLRQLLLQRHRHCGQSWRCLGGGGETTGGTGGVSPGLTAAGGGGVLGPGNLKGALAGCGVGQREVVIPRLAGRG
jgi:hypothetical protein